MYNFSSDDNRRYVSPPQFGRSPILSSRYLREVFSGCADFEERSVSLGLEGHVCLSVLWLDGIVSGADVSECIIKPLTEYFRYGSCADEESAYGVILDGGVYSRSVSEREDAADVVTDITHGSCAVIFDTLSLALCFEVRTSQNRSVSEPTLEKSLKGGKDSFVEALRTNTSLVRRRLCTPQLKTIESTVGRRSRTKVSIMFLDGIAAPETVEELVRRLDRVDIDAVLATGIIEEAVCDCPASPFPQFVHTERPDRFAMHLADGRVGLLIDGIPVGLITPVTFAEFMKVTGDSSMHYIIAGGLTMLRYIAMLIGLLLPAFYVAIAMYHQEMIPTKLLLSIIEAKRGVPFSTALEIIGMMIAFSFLQEAGLRLPDPIGDTVSIIGALIVGQSAVDASLVSPIAIIVVAVSGIACYTLPSQDMGYALRTCRILLLLAAIFTGLFGIAAVCCLVFLHLARIDCFGADYTAPLTDGRAFGLFRLLVSVPKKSVKYRDPLLKTPDKRRQA